jgi:hypothetical protein
MEIVGADVMTIGDLLRGGATTQELFEIRLEAGQKARRILREEKGREKNLLATIEAMEMPLNNLYGRLNALRENKLPPNHPAVKKVEEAIKYERIRLQASIGYKEVHDDLKKCRAVQVRARMDLKDMPEDVSKMV